MAFWQIKVYHLAGGSCPIRDWYRTQDAPVQALFDVTLGLLAAREDWTDSKAFKVLTKKHAGLGEVRFKIEEKGKTTRRFRPVGIWPPIAPREFVLLVGCEKTNQIYIPATAFTEALRLKADLERGIGEVHDYI